MAGMKQLSAGSSQILMMMFRDKNNAPIKADSVHVKGSIFTGSSKPFEFEVNKGVCTNCKIQNDMLLFNIVPLLGLGQMQVYTQTFLGDAKAITGTYVSENQQKLGVEVVNKGTFLSDRQGAMWVDVYLPIEINDAAQIPWVPAGADEQWVKDYLDKYVKTPAFAAVLANLAVADNTLSNVDAKDFEKKVKDGNFAQNDLADVDLVKLKEKGNVAGLAYKDMSNIPTNIVNCEIRMSAAYQKLANLPHPATQGKTSEQIKALFYTNRQEVKQGVNLNQSPYTDSTTLMMAYQMANNQTIQQTLPPVADNRIIIVDVLQQNGAANYKLVLSAQGGETIQGSSDPITLTEDGLAGILIPILNENTWEWMPYHKLPKPNLALIDEFGTFIDAVASLIFKKPFKLTWNNDTKQAELSVEGGMPMSFVDTITKKTISAALGQSADGSIRISLMPKGKDDDGNDLYVIDFSVAKTAAQEGVAMALEYVQIFNTDFPEKQPNFSNMLYKGGYSVQYNKQTGGIITQEVDNKDPNITGGTTFLALLDYVPDAEQENLLNQDGSIRLALVDKDGNYIKTLAGGNAVVQRDYKAGDKVKEMHLDVVFKMKSYTEVFYKIEGDFENEEGISVGIGSGICVQAIEDGATGEALEAYELYTDTHVEIGKKIYSTNNINFARAVVKDTITIVKGAYTEDVGNGLYIDTRTNNVERVVGNGFNIKSNNNEPLVFSIYKIYSYRDLMRLKGCDIDISAEVKNKLGALRVVQLGYKGVLPAPKPNLLSFNNDQPQYNKGWTEIDSLFIPEDATSEKRRLDKTFIFPEVTAYDECTFLLRPETATDPADFTIYDFEGDIKPGFVHTLIKERFYAGQQTLIKRDMFTKSAILLSGNETVLRFTINKADTKIPVGVFKRNHFLKNNNAWYDAGSANKEVQGDIAILKSFKGKLSYSVNVFNEQNTDNTVEFWLARVEADGTFTKIADSVLSTTVKKNTLPANTNNQKTIVAFEHDFKKGESYRLFAKSNKDDGAFIQVNAGSHVAMVEVIVDVKYITEIPQDIIHANNIAQIKLMDGDVEVQDTENYTIQIDVKTGAVTIKKK